MSNRIYLIAYHFGVINNNYKGVSSSLVWELFCKASCSDLGVTWAKLVVALAQSIIAVTMQPIDQCVATHSAAAVSYAVTDVQRYFR